MSAVLHGSFGFYALYSYLSFSHGSRESDSARLQLAFGALADHESLTRGFCSVSTAKEIYVNGFTHSQSPHVLVNCTPEVDCVETTSERTEMPWNDFGLDSLQGLQGSLVEALFSRRFSHETGGLVPKPLNVICTQSRLAHADGIHPYYRILGWQVEDQMLCGRGVYAPVVAKNYPIHQLCSQDMIVIKYAQDCVKEATPSATPPDEARRPTR